MTDEERHMHRRTFLVAVSSVIVGQPAFAAANQKFIFRVKTKDGGIIGNVLIEAADVEAAKVKLMKRYPGSTILNVKTK